MGSAKLKTAIKECKLIVGRSRRMSVAVLFVFGFFCIASVRAAYWQTDVARSRLGFVATWEDMPIEGVFHRYDAEIIFDTQALEKSSFNVTVDMTSVDTNSRDLDEALAGPDWFSFQDFPRATFFSNQITQVAGSHFEARGRLTLRGVGKNIVLPFIWERSIQGALLQGEVQLNRLEFNVGKGEWASGKEIGLDVKVVVDLNLRQPR